MITPEKEAWPEGVIARYGNDFGATIDITMTKNDDNGGYYLFASVVCTGCRELETFEKGGASMVPHVARDRVLMALRPLAQRHAETCRAIPDPAGAREEDGR